MLIDMKENKMVNIQNNACFLNLQVLQTAYHYSNKQPVFTIKLKLRQLSLMYVVCELRSPFLQNIFLNVIFAKK